MRRQYSDFDIWMTIAVVLLMGFGLIMIGSATRISILGESAAFRSQLIFIPLGLVIFAAAAFIDYHFIARFYVPIYLLCLLLLIATQIHGELNDIAIRRWIHFNAGGFSLGIQPSEFAKVFMIIFLAKLLDTQGERINKIHMLAMVAVLVGAPVWLIVQQPSLSAGVVVLVICMTVMFVGNVGGRYVLFAMAVLTPIAIFLVYDFGRDEHIFLHYIARQYQLDRIETLLNPELADADSTFQIQRSLQAIGSGQLVGQGLHQGQITQSAGLPAAETDFIVSVIGEEFGFLGVMGVLLIMLLVVGRCFYIAAKAPDMLGRLIASGVTMMLAFQTFVNVGVVTELLPNTGVPFPFLSYGGSSLWASLIAIGLVINVNMTKAKSMFEI